MACPVNSITFNRTLCACAPGRLLAAAANACELFEPTPEDWRVGSGVDGSFSFSLPFLSFGSIKNFARSQGVFLEATAVVLVCWLGVCFGVRWWGRKVKDGRSVWFRVRWGISRMDVCYATRHWLDDQKVVRKRKTELGGTFSIASWILFIGLFAALLYQMISRRSVEVHNVRATNGPELLSFINDMEFNITTISSMTCSHLRGLGTVVTGTPGFIDSRTTSLSVFANYSCHNTSLGPTIMIQCSHCKVIRDDFYISWQFVDLPNNPATSVGFQFNMTAINPRDRKRISFVTGTVKNGSNTVDRPTTFRGPEVNVLKFHLFPRMYRHLHNLKLIQPLFHEFIPGSSCVETSQLQASLQRPQDGLINITLAVNFLSAYVIEIDSQHILEPVTFFADLGGLYVFSFAIFFYILMQCEHRIKKLRNEDGVLQSIRNKTKAKKNWNKLRKYVTYTWGCKFLEDANETNGVDALCGCTGSKSSATGSQHKNGSQHKRKQTTIQMDTISLNRKGSLPTVVRHEDPGTEMSEMLVASNQSRALQPRTSYSAESTLPPPPEYKTCGTDISDIQKNLQNLYEYNVLLREKFIASQIKIDELTKKASDPH